MQSTLKLYELAEARGILDQWLDESEGELTPEIEELLNHLDGKVDEKVERVGLYIRERLAHARAVKDERDRLDALAKRDERAAESLKGYLKHCMEQLGKTKVPGLLATVSIQKNSQPAVTTGGLAANELYAVPEAQRFVRREETVIYTLDREAILAAWRRDEPLPMPIVVDLGSHIRIR